MKALIVVATALVVCWVVGKFINLGGTIFHVAQVPVSWAMLLFVGTVMVVANRVK